MKKIYNPYLPLNEYIPDAEPHVFGDRVYVFGSHDMESGDTFCMLDYVCYSASIYDLKDWKYEGVIYKASQDPDYNLLESECSNVKRTYMYAPDVVKGNDGRYYLYYCMSGYRGQGGYHGPISVAVCDTPCGEYKYLGIVKYKDGRTMREYVPFDPAVINDDGVIRLYYGTQYLFEEYDNFFDTDEYLNQEMSMFNKSKEEILEYAKKDSVMGAIMLTLEDDMLTVKDNPKHIIPYKVKNTSFEAHPFFEGSSIRKVNGLYYFIYSSLQNHELCYAISKYPDREFEFKGTIISNGDVGFNGRTSDNKLNMTGTTHGSIECINNEWYVFYHRLTHKSDYSRQDCAEKIEIDSNGLIKQVEVTSCGLNGGPLEASGVYPAVICCVLTNGKMPHGSNKKFLEHFPNVNNEGDNRFITEISNNTLIGYRYFSFDNVKEISLNVRAKADCIFEIYDEMPMPYNLNNKVVEPIASISVKKCEEFSFYKATALFKNGIHPIYIIYKGEDEADLKEIAFSQ